MNGKARRGFSLTEIVIVIVIIGVLALVGVGFGSKQIAASRMTSMENNLRIIGSEIEKAVIDLGFLETVDEEEHVNNYFEQWERKYLTCHLDVANMRIIPAGGAFGADYSGAIISTTNYKDPWGTELQLFYMIPTSTGISYRIIVASAGSNSVFAADAATGYINGEREDDVMIAMIPRE